MGRIQGKYDQWRVEERVSLILQASARGDESELNRLYASAPRHTLRGPDLRFLKAMQAVFAVNCWIAIELWRRLGMVNGIGVASIAADTVIHDVVRHGIAAQLDLMHMLGTTSKTRLRVVEPTLREHESPLDLNGLISPALTTVVTEIVSLRSALDKFARQELNVSADQLLDAMHPELNAQLQAPIFSQIPATDEVEAVVTENLHKIWTNILG